jgi:integrase
MVEVQRLTGMRPGEVCLLRPCDIQMSGRVWLFAPRRHKTAHRGKVRTVAIGPRAQKVLREFLTEDAEAYVFSPARAVAELHAERTKARETPRYRSHMARNKAKRTRRPRRAPGERYTSMSYAHAVARACEKAGVEQWRPNQLRHTFATRVRKSEGLEAAQVALGHARANVTEIYAERDRSRAVAVAAKLG